MFIWAHRGASKVAPENTMTAFQAAAQQGADGIELDVQLSRDRVAVVLHDDTLERTTDGRGPVANWPLRRLAELDAGSWFAPAFAGEPLPTLAQVCSWAEGQLRLNLEIKSAGAARQVLALIAQHPRLEVLVSSFDHRLLAALRRDQPRLPLGFLSDSRFWRRDLQRAVASRAESFHPRYPYLSRPMLQQCRRQGLAVYPWTVDGRAELLRCRRLGVDGVFTNLPGPARDWLASAELPA